MSRVHSRRGPGARGDGSAASRGDGRPAVPRACARLAQEHDPYYVGYTGKQWSDDYGIREGRCDRDRVGAALGAAVGGAIGAAVSDGDDQLIAILAGATIGAIIGHEIGDEMDDNDRRMLRPFAGTARGRPARHLGRQPGRPDIHACS